MILRIQIEVFAFRKNDNVYITYNDNQNCENPHHRYNHDNEFNLDKKDDKMMTMNFFSWRTVNQAEFAFLRGNSCCSTYLRLSQSSFWNNHHSIVIIMIIMIIKSSDL